LGFGESLTLTHLTLPEEVSRAILGEARSLPLEEVCGLLIGVSERGGVRVERSISCRNTEPAERRQNRFSIDPRVIIEVERELRGTGGEVVGFYHSHPFGDALPSAVDLAFMELWPDALWLILERTGEEGAGRMRSWKWEPEAPRRVREIALSDERG
jgi:proteasome lid subunit RPN8/RPN11